MAGTLGPTATRVPAFARLAGTVEGANERVVHGMFTREEACVGAARVGVVVACRLCAGRSRDVVDRGRARQLIGGRAWSAPSESVCLAARVV